ncbi:MAG: hypothetical protein E3K36_04480 [Candidatus Brocadia sp.]|nr:hypothetical protein [Candidatus Brocadia sp.]
MKVEYLKMIGHGTNGSDGIEEGIHLRWAFHDKLGFPACFKLYRRKSDIGNRYEFQLQDLPNQTLNLPYTQEIEHNTDLKIRLVSAEINGNEVEALTVEEVTPAGGLPINMIPINGELRISFSKPVARIELGFLVSRKSRFQIIAQTKDGDYYPHTVFGGTGGFKNISFDAPGTMGIVLRGREINLAALAGWICTVKGEWKRINELCGCGLPVNQEGTPYVNDVYPPIIGRDLATALCRLGYLNVADSPITAAEFLELKAMLLSMVDEGSLVPVGWTLFPNNEEAATDETMECSKYDFLLAQSLHVFFARILDLYFVDKDTDNDTYYDYKVTAEWPGWNKRRLDHEITFDDYQLHESFFPIQQLDDHVVLYAPKPPQIAESSYPLFRTELGLDVTAENLPIVINFLKPVTEVQLVLVNPDFTPGSKITVEAYKHLFSAWVDREDLLLERGMLRLRAEQIDSIKIHTSHAILCRIHYDFDPYPVDLQQYIICGVSQQSHLPLTRPTGLAASFLPGGTVTDQDGNVTEKPYLAGLRWDVNEDPEKELISLAPVLYHIERKLEGGAVELLTEDSPIFVTPLVVERSERNIPIGWPKERQYYTEAITRETVNHYRIAAIDLFGRQSEFTEFETYELTAPKPPHPIDVKAQFLDCSTYNPSEDSFADSMINDIDKDWLRANRKNAIVVRWKWPENLQLQAPDVEGFNVYFMQGWLNTYTGIIVTEPIEVVVAKTSLNLTQKELEKYAIFEETPEDIPVYTFQISLDVYPPPLPEPIPFMTRDGERAILPEDAFRLCWLTQGNHSFLILKNNGESQPSLWVLKLNDIPLKDKGFGIAVTAEKKFFIDYKNPEHWTDNRITHQEPKDLRADYTVYIEDPAFPNPAIEASDINKVRYAQIGVNSFIGDVLGSVSPPSTIMAIYRGTPAAPIAFAPLPDEPIQALKATPANVHGKSSFALRWQKEKTSVKHYVYRVLDDTLFVVDNKIRQTRSASVYDDFKANHPEFDPADVDVVKEISFESNPKLVAQNYAGLTPGQLQILASLPDNVNAFTELNGTPIDESDPAYEDRITEIPDPVRGATYTPDPANVLLYVDETLDGRGNNRYFYALRSVDTNGMQSVLSLATPPVEVPKTTPAPAPVITAVAGGENQITIRWAKNPGAEIAGYLLYRTQDNKKAKDWRRMEFIKANDTDTYTVEVTEPLPQKEFEFIDNTVLPRQPYYYGLVAVGLDDNGKQLKSRMSSTKSGQAYDLTPPEPPQWDEVNSGWVYVDDNGTVYEWGADLTEASNPQPAIRLVWMEDARVKSVLIARIGASSSFSAVIANWVSGGSFITGRRFHLDRLAGVSESYTYVGKSKSHAKLLSTSQTTIVIDPPSDPSNAVRIRPNVRRRL